MKYQILQIKDFESCNYVFVNYERAVKYGFNLDDYEVVYEGTVEAINNDLYDTLEYLFYIFNCQRPIDFTGHSLSVSDIICVEDEYYYVDSCGFKKI